MKTCLIVCLVAIAGTLAQERCGTNEHFELCGTPCPGTCQNPNPVCIPRCSMGCFCNGNRLRDDRTRNCVRPSNCPSLRTGNA